MIAALVAQDKSQFIAVIFLGLGIVVVSNIIGALGKVW